MNLMEIRNGTILTITFEDGSEFQAEFDESISPINFYIISPEIVQNIEQHKGATVKFNFNAWNTNYTFTGKITGIRPGHNNIISCTATSFIKKLTLRADVRIQIRVKVKIYTYAESGASSHLGRFLCEATSEDISRGGIRIWLDQLLDMPPDNMFTLEISPFLSSSYVLPAKIVRCQQNTSTRIYNYDYGFVFPPHLKEQREKLILDIVQSGMLPKV